MHCACELGHGFLESMYQEAPERKFVEQAIPDERALPISLSRQLLTPDFKNSAIEFRQPKSPITGDWSSICDGMKSCSNRRWANREDLVNVPGGTRECLQRARVAEGPKVR